MKLRYNAIRFPDEDRSMSSITISLREEKLLQLQEVASRLGVSVEVLARLSLEELLAEPDEQFETAAAYVLKKNQDLYRRLA
jgi:antitoxin FitA